MFRSQSVRLTEWTSVSRKSLILVALDPSVSDLSLKNNIFLERFVKVKIICESGRFIG